MSDFIWHWKTNNNNKVFTRQVDIAEKAMKDGFFVMGVKAKPRIFGIR